MDHYFFDKRIMKKIFLKYGLMILALFPILILINSIMGLESGTMIVVDVAIGLVYILLVEVMLSKISKWKESKKDGKKEKNVEEIVIEAETVEEKRKNRQKTSKKDKK